MASRHEIQRGGCGVTGLDTLEGLFDFYFVQPATLKKKRHALNANLANAKKPPMK